MLSVAKLPPTSECPTLELPLAPEMRSRREADITQVRNNAIGLTKLDYNFWLHSDGWQVTLKIADAVGEVLISSPAISNAPLAFKHYF